MQINMLQLMWEGVHNHYLEIFLLEIESIKKKGRYLSHVRTVVYCELIHTIVVIRNPSR